METAAKDYGVEVLGQRQGEVKSFNPEKGFGFLTTGQGPDVFVHFTQIISEGFRTLVKGQRVKFLMCQGEKGLSATKVEILA